MVKCVNLIVMVALGRHRVGLELQVCKGCETQESVMWLGTSVGSNVLLSNGTTFL